MRKLTKKIIALALSVFMICAMLPMGVFAAGEDTEYVLYPIPHEISYGSGSYTLQNINVIYGSGMDQPTKNRLSETAALRGLTVTEGTAAVSGKTNIYVAINGSGDTVANYITGKYTASSGLFSKTDAYFLASSNGEIVVLGRDVDSCFYGLTTLYQIFGQLESNTLRNFTINDYADVTSRGFIEGYYGNPWSTQDRINLMTWGGYYKLNSYFYAPKDDPKHNANWRELYTDEELNTLIKPLAEAGNNSKCRFVFALHPYMHDPIRYTSDAVYQEDLNILKQKFLQAIKVGVRQIAIMADDCNTVGQSNYIKTLNDMTAWIQSLQSTYPDLKLLLPFVAPGYEYSGYGQSYYRNFPENIQIMMTGGQVWGFCSPYFTNTFYNNVGRGAYMWINWPCSDNSKNHLIMGGYSDFLQVGVDPSKLEGIVLNPMQQSEPSKVAIFGNACYCWNIWETEEEADAAWETSFACVDHNTVVPNAASEALKELSKHMIEQNVFKDNNSVLEESVVLRTELQNFQNKLSAGTYTQEDIDSLIEEFTILQNAAKVYRAQGNETINDQIVYWIDCWDDTTLSVISYLEALSAIKGNEGDSAVWGHYATGQAAYESSKTHALWYMDHWEYAEVGMKFISPFMKTLSEHLSGIALDIVYPQGRPVSNGGTGSPLNLTAFDGNHPGYYEGTVARVVDGSTSSYVWYNGVAQSNQYIGVNLGKPVKVGTVTFTQDSGDHFYSYELQYSNNGTDYTTYGTYTDAVLNVDLAAAGIVAQYIRFVSSNSNGMWVKIYEIAVTEAPATNVLTNREALESLTSRIVADRGELVISGSTSVTLAPGEYLGLDLGRIKDLNTVTVTTAARTVSGLTLEVSKNHVDWVEIEPGATTEDARYVRLINKTSGDITINLTEFSVDSTEVCEPTLHSSDIGVNSSWGVSEDSRDNGAAFDGDVSTTTEFGDFVTAGEYIIYDLGQTRDIRKLEIYCAGAALNYIRDAKIQISNDLSGWTDVITIGDGVENTGEADVTCVNSDAGYSQTTSSHPNYVSIEGTVASTPARYIRILMTAANNERAVLFNEIEINDGEYASVSNDPTFVSSAIEVQGYAPQSMTDGDLTTSWKANTAEAGSMLYTFSDNLEANRIHIVQQGISNAKVSLYVENDGVREWVEVGNLDQSLKKIVCENDLNLALKIEWTAGNAPSITEIVRYSVEAATVTKVTLEVDETKTFTVTGDLTGADVSGLNTNVATVALKGIASSSTRAAGSAVSAIASGSDYLVVNTRAGKTVINTSSSTSDTADGSMAGLSLNGNVSTVVDAAVWTISATNTANVYNVRSSNGKYMTIGVSSGGLVDTAQPITMVYANNNWTLMQNNAYLNDAGGLGTTASGWQNAAAATDPGSQWTIYEIVTNEVIGSTEITFTGVAPGTTSVLIGGVNYEITVVGDTDCTHEHTEVRDAKDATCKEPGYTGDTWCKDCETKIETGTVIEKLAHTPAEAVREKEVEATCTAEGSYDEVVYCDLCGEVISRETVTLDALGHAYGTPEYTWSEDGKTCTAKRTCANNAAHVETATATVTSEVTKAPTCEAKGETTYTATFDVDWAETQTKTIADVAVVDHTPAEAVREKEVEATCDKAGSYDEVVYCSVCGEEISRKTVTVDALGHKDANKDHKCDKCDEVLSECVDENKDYKCDICGKDLEKPEDPEDPEQPVEKDEVIRLAGSHRWETALKVADEMKANLGLEKFDAIIIASGNDFADALAGSYLSTVKNAPILLGWGNGGKYEYLDTDNIEYIKANLAENGVIYILGGEKAVPKLYEDALKGYNVKRLGGANRFETNLLILAEAGVADGSEILVCTSTNFADSLSASATAKPILLVFNEYGKLYGKQPEFLAGLKNCTFTVIGGESAVSADLAKAIETYGKVERLAGANRFETSVMVAQKYFKDVDTAVLAYAWNYPDGLCGGSLAYSLKAPLILTMTKYESQAVAYAKEAGITTGLVLGGDTLISDEAVRAIFAMDAADEIIEK